MLYILLAHLSLLRLFEAGALSDGLAFRDYVVVEIVERNLKNLAVKAPVMPAPAISYNDDMKSETAL